MKIDGRCHCGGISYEAEVDPATARVCHCTDCQVLSGTAFRTVVSTREEDFTLLSGTPKAYIKTAESGNQRAQVFCPDCGTALYATGVGDGPKLFGLRVGAIRQRAALPPIEQIWSRSAADWLDELTSLPRKEQQT
jgi:hypothetical protein